MKIVDLKTRTVVVPIEAPLRHSTGVHPGHFIRTIVELVTDEGITGLGEVGGGDQAAALMRLKPRIVGEDPFQLERIKQRTLRQIYYLSNQRLYAALEIACLDIQGKATRRPLSDVIGGRVRDRVQFCANLCFRYPNGGAGGETSPEEMVCWARRMVTQHGFTCAKLKAGVLPPEQEIEVMLALREAFGPQFGLRIDPNAYWCRGTAIKVGRALAGCGLEYFEDPTSGLEGMARVRENTGHPLATNMCVMSFEDLAPAFRMNAVDIILGDIYYWEGIRGFRTLAGICESFNWGLSMHSGSELGVTMAAMLHAAASVPNLNHPVDTLYNHLVDDVIVGGKMAFQNGAMAVPLGYGLGVELDEDKMQRYQELFRKKGDYYARFHEDKRRPDWFPIKPGW